MAGSDGVPALTPKQVAKLELAVRHVGRAMAAAAAANLPLPPSDGSAPWLDDLAVAERALQDASNSLIEGLEGMPTQMP